MQKLYPMELQAESNEKKIETNAETTGKDQERPTRIAALEAKSVIKAIQMAEEENQVWNLIGGGVWWIWLCELNISHI